MLLRSLSGHCNLWIGSQPINLLKKKNKLSGIKMLNQAKDPCRITSYYMAGSKVNPNWLSERARWAYLAHSGLPILFPQKRKTLLAK